MFAAHNAEFQAWNQSLCEATFPMSRNDWTMQSKSESRQQSLRKKSGVLMEDNELYASREGVKEFRVTIHKTVAAERCQLWGTFNLNAEKEGLELRDVKSGEILYTWPYRFLRRFGRDKVTFSFEAGRRCVSGEGSFEFDTRHGNAIFQVIESAIKVQKQLSSEEVGRPNSLENETLCTSRGLACGGPEVEHSDLPGEEQGQKSTRVKGEGCSATLPPLRGLSLDTTSEPRNVPRKHPPTASATLKPQSVGPRLGLPQPPKAESTYSQVRAPSNKNPQPQASEANSEYAVPFDAIARSLILTNKGCFTLRGAMGDGSETMSFSTFLPQSSPTGPAPSDPLYDSIDESLLHPRPKARPTKDPIYDEPEGVADSCLYDMPEEMKGHAWKLQGLAGDPGGHEVPYNPQTDDYAVPKEAGAKHGPSKQGSRERLRDNASSQCEYDNIMFKFQDKKGNQLV
eukprot:gi/632989178/ref/XP_007883510.1/ PREDICTED: docking protein 2-like [Callorhinchus milii]